MCDSLAEKTGLIANYNRGS